MAVRAGTVHLRPITVHCEACGGTSTVQISGHATPPRRPGEYVVTFTTDPTDLAMLTLFGEAHRGPFRT